MAIEHATTRVVRKPWGSVDLRPWSEICDGEAAIGELWFQRADPEAPEPALLLKLLFTQEPLSIQVHPDDTFAQSVGLPHGKTEAWYILSATPEGKVAVGLKRQLAPAELRAAIEDGSITDLIQWNQVFKDDVIFVPAGTIHAIGAGLVVAEIQQRSDATFRLFDHGRRRELHVNDGMAVAEAGPAECQSIPRRLTDIRTLLVTGPHFVFERIDLAPNSNWTLHAERETWVLVLEGHARVGPASILAGEAVFMEAERARIEVGFESLKGLLAYVGTEPGDDLLRNLDEQTAGTPARLTEAPL